MLVTQEILMENKVKNLKKEIKELKKKILVQNATAVGFAVGFISSIIYILVK